MRPWKMDICRIVPYVPGDQPVGGKLIKLNTNKNPYPPTSGIERTLREMDADRLCKYPGPSSAEFVAALVEYYGVGGDRVFVGVDSDDVIAMSFLTFFNPQRPVLFPDITYSFYKVWADLYRIPYEAPALNGDMVTRSLDYKKENGGITFPNPNASADFYMPLDRVEEIVKVNQDVIVVVDEACIDFVDPSTKELLSGHDNLLVVQTFSRSHPVAGVRIGLALGSPTLIKALDDVKYSCSSYIANLPSQIAGAQVVRDGAHFEGTRTEIMTTRERSKRRLVEPGFTFPDLMINFIPVTHGRALARAIFNALKKEQIYVHYFNAPRFDSSLWVSTGMGEEMDVLFQFLEEYLKGWRLAEDSG